MNADILPVSKVIIIITDKNVPVGGFSYLSSDTFVNSTTTNLSSLTFLKFSTVYSYNPSLISMAFPFIVILYIVYPSSAFITILSFVESDPSSTSSSPFIFPPFLLNHIVIYHMLQVCICFYRYNLLFLLSLLIPLLFLYLYT